jgi:glycosyltransferase involved in cell wall biosynthesis
MRIILLPGRITRTKGHEILIKALSLMKHADVIAIFVGSALGHESYRDHLLQMATSLDLAHRVKWMPPCPDLPAAYQISDLIVCPSLKPEGFGRLMAEAQAMKKPIIAFDHGGAQEIIEQGKTGWLVPPGNAEALAQAIDYVLDLSQDLIYEVGTKGREQVKTCFSQDIMSAKTIAVYQELLEWGH